MSILLLLLAFLPIDFHVGPRVAGSLIVADIFVFDVFIVGEAVSLAKKAGCR